MARGEECTSPPGLEKHKTSWHIDSAATSHMTFNRSLFSSYQSVPPFPVQMGDSSTALAVGRGDVQLNILKDGKMATCELRNVLHVPSFVFSLISVPTLAKKWSSSPLLGLHGHNTSERRTPRNWNANQRSLRSRSLQSSALQFDSSRDRKSAALARENGPRAS